MAFILAFGASASSTGAPVTLDCINECNAVPFCDLLPQGAMWPRARDTTLFKVCSSFAPELSRVDKQVLTMLRESYPDTAQETLTHFESISGIPDVCDGVVKPTISLRQDEVIEVWRQDHTLNDAFWESIAVGLGYTAPVITKSTPFCTGVNCAGDALCPLEATLGVTFTFDSGLDDVLLECKIRRFWPIFSTLTIVFTP